MTNQFTELLSLANIAAPIQYPVIQTEVDLAHSHGENSGIVDRVQVQVGEYRHCMLVRHVDYGHWCGYVLVDPTQWLATEKRIRSIIAPRISHAGYATRYITWMRATDKGRLSVPTTIHTGDSESDFWIGFDTARNQYLDGLSEDYHEVLAALYGFENVIHGVISGRISFGR